MNRTSGIGKKPADGRSGTVAFFQVLVVVAGDFSFDRISADGAFPPVQRFDVFDPQDIIGLFQDFVQGRVLQVGP